MIYFTIALAAFLAIETVVLFIGWKIQLDYMSERARLWQHIEELEADKRALTESLCRATGKPFITPGKHEMIPASGWFDARPEIKVVS